MNYDLKRKVLDPNCEYTFMYYSKTCDKGGGSIVKCDTLWLIGGGGKKY